MDLGASADAAETMLRVVGKILDIIELHKRQVKVSSQELSIRVPEGTGELCLALEVQPGVYGGKIPLNIPNVTRISIHSSPAFKREDQSIFKDDMTLGFDPSKLSKDTKMVLLRVEYLLEDRAFLDTLVQRSSHLDPQDEGDIESYWMTAQLKNLSVLQKAFARLDLRGVDFNVDVGVYEDIKTKIPHKAMRSIERAAEFIGTRDRNRLLRIMLDQRKGMDYVGGDLVKAVRELTDLFLPTRFASFLNVGLGFRYHMCVPGAEMIESILLAIPKFMTVVSRTDLSLEEPARDGILRYHRGRMRNRIEKIFS